MNELKIFYRIYQDRESMIDYVDINHYVVSQDEFNKLIPVWKEGMQEDDSYDAQMIEPVLMTDEEFNKLPEFTGF